MIFDIFCMIFYVNAYFLVFFRFDGWLADGMSEVGRGAIEEGVGEGW